VSGSELVRLEGVSCRYGREPVLAGIDLAISAREFAGVVGPSGSGKTSLLRAILGTLQPSAGRVARRERLRVGYVPQVETVDWSFPVTVDQCVLMARVGRRLLPWASRAERAEVAGVLGRLGIGELGGRHIRELSGGQQQRVFIARALLQRPDLLLLDEPTSGVDVRLRHEVLHLLDDLNAAGVAILLTTHDLNGIAAHLPRLVCLNREVIGVGPPREVLTEEVLQRTYGASMEVLEHGGMVVVVDAYGRHGPIGRPTRGQLAHAPHLHPSGVVR
jgi:ABC-type Mn2+/Zn2+ transport system ATPase subunit